MDGSVDSSLMHMETRAWLGRQGARLEPPACTSTEASGERPDRDHGRRSFRDKPAGAAAASQAKKGTCMRRGEMTMSTGPARRTHLGPASTTPAAAPRPGKDEMASQPAPAGLHRNDAVSVGPTTPPFSHSLSFPQQLSQRAPRQTAALFFFSLSPALQGCKAYMPCVNTDFLKRVAYIKCVITVRLSKGST
jgi:hypothetical protein